MRTPNTWVALGCVAGLVAGIAGLAAADEGSLSYREGMLRKLGRGFTDIVTCPLELPRTASFVGQREGVVAAMGVGLVKGTWRAIQRGVVGVFEVVTFYAEVPKGFRPIMTPEFVFANGDWVE